MNLLNQKDIALNGGNEKQSDSKQQFFGQSLALAQDGDIPIKLEDQTGFSNHSGKFSIYRNNQSQLGDNTQTFISNYDETKRLQQSQISLDEI